MKQRKLRLTTLQGAIQNIRKTDSFGTLGAPIIFLATVNVVRRILYSVFWPLPRIFCQYFHLNVNQYLKYKKLQGQTYLSRM